MDDTSHVFLIKDKIRCIQKKIMDQLAADLNNALNDDNMLTSSISNVTMSSSHPLKTRRRRKRPTQTEHHHQQSQLQQKHQMDASDSTTPENTRQVVSHRHRPDSIVSDGDEAAIRSSNVSFRLFQSVLFLSFSIIDLETQSSSLAAASESDSTSQSEHRRRRRRPFKKPLLPSTSLLSPTSAIRLTRCSSVKLTDTNSSDTRRRRRHYRTDDQERSDDFDEHPSVASSSTFSVNLASNNFVGKRKRSRAIHEDFRLRNSSLHDYDMSCADEHNL